MKLMDKGIEPQNDLRFEERPVPQTLVLELLNHAVWAPNHRLREPWRFIYISDNNKAGLDFIQSKAPGCLIIAMKNENDTHKQDENLAAIFCLIQNFKLLAAQQKLGVNVSFEKWMYDRRHCQEFGLSDKERIAAVLDLGFYQGSSEVIPTVSVTLKWSLL